MAEPNPKYSFNNLFIYEGNKLAYSACDAVIKNKGIFNPLYIYSGEGMGKTHLVSACANYLLERGEKVMFYTPSEFQEVLSGKNFPKEAWVVVDDFHEFVRMGDVVQKLLIKNFESLIAAGNQLIFSSLYSLETFEELSPLLRSKLSGGIEVGILPPSATDVYEILKFKLAQKNIEMEEKVIKMIPIPDKFNFRKIEGIVNKVVLLYIVKKSEIDIEDIMSIFKKGGYEEVLFPDLRREIEESVSKIAEEVEEAKKIKEFLDEKIYVWKMKGFEIKRLEALKEEGNLEKIKREYDRFLEDVKRLIELQKKYGEMGITDEEIEKMIFDPDKVKEIEEKMEELEKKAEVEEFEEVPSIIVGEFNKDAVHFLQELANNPPGAVLIKSEGRNGISFLLEYGFSILKNKNKIFLDATELGESIISGNFTAGEYQAEYIFIDDFETLLKVKETQDAISEVLKKWLEEGKKIVLGAHGEVEIQFPCREIVVKTPLPEDIEKFVNFYSSQKGKIVHEDAMKRIKERNWRNLKELITFLEEIFSFPKKEISIDDVEFRKEKEQMELLRDLALEIDNIEELIWEEL